MNILVLHDVLGNEIYINPEHVIMGKKPHGGNPPNAKGVIVLSTGGEHAVIESAGEICFRLLEL